MRAMGLQTIMLRSIRSIRAVSPLGLQVPSCLQAELIQSSQEECHGLPINVSPFDSPAVECELM